MVKAAVVANAAVERDPGVAFVGIMSGGVQCPTSSVKHDRASRGCALVDGEDVVARHVAF